MEEVSLGEKKSSSFRGCRVKSSFYTACKSSLIFLLVEGVTGGVT